LPEFDYVSRPMTVPSPRWQPVARLDERLRGRPRGRLWRRRPI